MSTAIPRSFETEQGLRGPRYSTILSWFKNFRRDPIGFMEMCRREYGPVAVYRAPPGTGFVVSDPPWIQHVFETHPERYWKGRMMKRVGNGAAGPGLWFLDGEEWKTSREQIKPVFVRSRITEMTRHMSNAAEELVERWGREHRDGEPIELFREMSMTALDVAGRALFGVDLGERMAPFSDLMTQLLDHSAYLVNHAFVLPRWVPTKRNRAIHRDGERAMETLRWAIEERRRHPEPGPDLLSHMLALADDPENEFMTERRVYAEGMTFLAAGHETTGATLSFALALLAQNPDAEERLVEEVDRVLGGRTAARDDVKALEFTRRVGSEALRLYPPAPIIGRECLAGDEIAGVPVRAGAAVLTSPWVVQRDPLYWDEPERFDPDRFTPQRSAGRPRYAYFPFGGGPRRCIGEAFALAEIPIILATIVQRFRVRIAPGRSVRAKPLFTLRPYGGIWVTLERRSPRSLH